MNSGILVVAAQRELRRNLFDALDQAGYAQIHSARDVAHAAILLEGRPSLPPLQLMVMVLAGDEQQARSCCEQLRRLPGGADTPLIVVLAEEASLSPADLPAGIADWLSAAQIGNELVARWRRSQSGNPSSRKTAVAPAGDAHEDYRYVFEEGDSEWLIVDALTFRLLEVSPTLAR
ncbi:MAG: GGDEF-domain containing protein, partial [Lysobacterales bacterium]